MVTNIVIDNPLALRAQPQPVWGTLTPLTTPYSFPLHSGEHCHQSASQPAPSSQSPAPSYMGNPCLVNQALNQALALRAQPHSVWKTLAPTLHSTLFPLCIREMRIEFLDLPLSVFHILLSDPGVFFSWS